MERHALRDDQFARIENLLPGRPGAVGRNSDLGNRLFVDAVIWKFRVGTPWRDLPERFGGWCNTHKRFSRWAVSGVWENLFKVLADDPDNEYAMIDATIVRAHQHSAGARKKGGSIKLSVAPAAGSRPKSTQSLMALAIHSRSASRAAKFTTSCKPRRCWRLSSQQSCSQTRAMTLIASLTA